MYVTAEGLLYVIAEKTFKRDFGGRSGSKKDFWEVKVERKQKWNNFKEAAAQRKKVEEKGEQEREKERKKKPK